MTMTENHPLTLPQRDLQLQGIGYQRLTRPGIEQQLQPGGVDPEGQAMFGLQLTLGVIITKHRERYVSHHVPGSLMTG